MSAAVVVLAAGFAAAPAQARQPGDDSGICGCGKAHALQLRMQHGLPTDDGSPFYAPREALNQTDVISNDLDIEVIPANGTTPNTITGSNTMRVRSLVPLSEGGLTEFTFVLRSQYTVTAATLNGETPVTPTLPGPNSYRRVVTLDRAYGEGEEFTLRVQYTGTPVSVGLGSIEFGTQAGVPVMASLSEPYYAATWWPCKDGDVFLPGDNSDKATLRFAITAPSNLRSTANGVLESVTPVAGGKMRYQWVTNYPLPTYLVAFGTTNYNVWTTPYVYPLAEGGTSTMPVEFHIYPQSDTPSNRAAWEQCIPMLEAFRPIFGEYPFINEKYGIYQFPFGGGMEHQTNSGQGGFGESLTAHELAHQWWGDYITCKTWNDLWLNEGFATYSEALWQERKPGSSGLPALHAAMASRRPTATSDTVYLYATNNINRMFSSNYTYRKAAWVLHMLRYTVGDGLFYDLLREYREVFGGGAASTEDFIAIASSVCGTDLSDYFQQWVYGGGAPAYNWGWQSAVINGRHYARVRIRQSQDVSYGVNGAFRMPVEFHTTVGGQTVVSRLNNTARTQHFLVPLAGAPSAPALDPTPWILATANNQETYVAGPPKVVEVVSPFEAPPAGVTAGAVVVGFSDNVNAPSSAFTLTGPDGPVACAFSYNAATWRAVLVPQEQLSAGAYTVTVTQAVTASGLALDGEPQAALPSGDGVAGGAFTFTFSAPQPCIADFNGDNGVDDLDIAAFFAAFEAGEADVNGDDGVDDLDISAFFTAFEAGC